MTETTFKELLTKPQLELFGFLYSKLKAYGYNPVDNDGVTLSAQSSLPNQVCLVAHLDTINTARKSYSYTGGTTLSQESEWDRTPKEQDILFTNDFILLSPMANPKIQCLGADDRVGVKTILDVLEAGLRPHILFTTDEEVSCLGSRQAVSDNRLEWLSEASMLIQIDRGVHEGKWNEMVTYDYDPTSLPEVFQELSKTYEMAIGSYTDVAVLGPYANKPIVNVSASYKNEHTTREFINLQAYHKNTEGLIGFVQWAQEQDTSDWVYVAKPKPKPVRSTYTGNLSMPKQGKPRKPIMKGNTYAKAQEYLDAMDQIPEGVKTSWKPIDTYNTMVKNGKDECWLLEYLDLAHDEGYYFTSFTQLSAILRGQVYGNY